jgi:hypothetical protein
MDDKQNNSSLRRYNNHIDEENNHQQIESNKRRRSSITNEQSLSSNNQDFGFNRNIPIENRKRSAQDDMITYTTHHFLREHEQYVSIGFDLYLDSFLFVL